MQSLLLGMPVETLLHEIAQLTVSATQSIVRMTDNIHSINDIHNLK